MLGLNRERVELVAHHDAWRVAFTEEADRLRDALGDRIVAVEQIGSTAIPDVPAKPVLDLLVTVPAEDLDSARELLPAVESLGYDRRETPVAGRLFFVRGPPEARTHYLSVAPHGNTFHREKIAFREYLRANPETAAEYARRKRELADAHPEDRNAYTNGKSAFVERVLDDALPEYAPDVS